MLSDSSLPLCTENFWGTGKDKDINLISTTAKFLCCSLPRVGGFDKTLRIEDTHTRSSAKQWGWSYLLCINGMINDMSVFKMKFIHPCCKLSTWNYIFMNLKTNIKLILNYDAEHEIYFLSKSNRLGIIIMRLFVQSNHVSGFGKWYLWC